MSIQIENMQSMALKEVKPGKSMNTTIPASTPPNNYRSMVFNVLPGAPQIIFLFMSNSLGALPSMMGTQWGTLTISR
jgi:hypothetical protein